MRSEINDIDFSRVCVLSQKHIGIVLNEHKRMLVENRLRKRVKLLGCKSYGAYLDRVEQSESEKEYFINAITTNETAFFRESKHFNFLYDVAKKDIPYFKVWSAASSTGEEAYSIAMTLASARGKKKWQVLATDINTEVVNAARLGRYPMGRHAEIPEHLLKKYALRGVNAQKDYFIFNEQIRKNMKFEAMNLFNQLPSERFEAAFLRNILIYFDFEKKSEIVNRVTSVIVSGGYLILGHTESISEMKVLKRIQPSIYQKL